MFFPAALNPLLQPPEIIRSIQLIDITIPAGATSQTQAVNSINTGKSILFWGGFTTSQTSPILANTAYPRIEITNSTTITAYRNTSDATHTVTIKATLVEFEPWAVKSANQYTIQLNALPYAPPGPGGEDGALNVLKTISSVDVSNSCILWLGMISAATAVNATNQQVALELESATTVRALRNATGSALCIVGFAVLEFEPGIVKSRQARAVTLTSNTTTNSDTISSVSTANTILFYNGCIAGISAFSNSFYNLQLTSSTSVLLSRAGTNTTSRTVKYTALELNPGHIKSIQRGTVSLSTSIPIDATINAVNTAKTVCNMCNKSTNGVQPDRVFSSVKLLNSTTIRGEKTGGTSTTTAAFEAIEWN